MSIINAKLIFTHMQFNSRQKVIGYLAKQLSVNGYVRDSFEKSVLEREERFPTGLPVGKYAVAIPHTDWQHVKQSTIAVATLAEPVVFHNMAVKDENLAVRMVIMLAMSVPHGQVKLLSEVMSLVQDQGHFERLINYQSNEALYKDLEQQFSKLNFEQS
ncbi:PTS sugar transporter subunit IIA [Sporolactobacillus shoreicorticis]|uniref:PTS sugar transporter subunit IIA n=1 Tax=Sporolactobacillus shoreicorticis TaxID=1923877 RepID=A0ABW5S1F5_9BACL|nr:PTS sugar transporter subunit IIA [Sporolactobacillus shoreicorticis]MCO7124489.1 PTS sugar transporter subunit IIA [Sporolactobacillus shoreicorticis]